MLLVGFTGLLAKFRCCLILDALFKNEKIEEWINGAHRLHLFLDSFDECLLRIDIVGSLLADEFKTGKYPELIDYGCG